MYYCHCGIARNWFHYTKVSPSEILQQTASHQFHTLFGTVYFVYICTGTLTIFYWYLQLRYCSIQKRTWKQENFDICQRDLRTRSYNIPAILKQCHLQDCNMIHIKCTMHETWHIYRSLLTLYRIMLFILTQFMFYI